VEEPKCLRKWGFWDSPCHAEWPKVADTVIKADGHIPWRSGAFLADIVPRNAPHFSDRTDFV